MLIESLKTHTNQQKRKNTKTQKYEYALKVGIFELFINNWQILKKFDIKYNPIHWNEQNNDDLQSARTDNPNNQTNNDENDNDRCNLFFLFFLNFFNFYF